MTENAITTYEPRGIGRPRSIFDMTDGQVTRLKLVAQMYASSMFNKASKDTLSEGDAFMIMLKGMEVGLEPMAAMDNINIIQGKPTISPQGMMALINNSGQLENMTVVGDAKSCTVTMKRTGRQPHAETFTMQNAASMGLTNKYNWKAQPATMLKWRAVSAAARVVFPDVIQGMYTPEEIASDLPVNEEGELVLEEPALPAPQPQKTTPSLPDKTVDFPTGEETDDEPTRATKDKSQRRMGDSPEQTHWAGDQSKRGAVAKAMIDAGFGSDSRSAWEFAKTNLEPGKTLGGMSQITLTYEATLQRIAKLAAELSKETQPEPAAEWSDMDKLDLDVWLDETLGISTKEVKQQFGIDLLATANLQAALIRAHEIAAEHDLPMIVTHVAYVNYNRKKVIQFDTLADLKGVNAPAIRMFGGRSELEKQLGKDFTDTEGTLIEDWEIEESYIVPEVEIVIEAKDTNAGRYYQVSSAKSLVEPVVSDDMPL